MIISISDLRINNKPATGVVRITDQYPTVSWSYDFVDRVSPSSTGSGAMDSVGTASPGAFEIRIGTGGGGQGGSGFLGDIVQTGYITSDASSWRYNGTRLRRGVRYYGQVRVKDHLGNVSSWSSFNFLFNALPLANSTAITPSSPSASSNLSLSYTYFDPDSDIESGTKIWWYKDGVHRREFDGLTTIESKHLSYGESWYAKVYPSDGHETGPVSTSNTVTVTTTPPVVETLSIIPSAPTYVDPLFAKYDYSSANGLGNQSEVVWYVNGVEAGSGSDFVRLDLSEGDVVHFEVTPSDGVRENAVVSSANIVIADVPFYVVDMRMDNHPEPLSVESLTPTVTWRVVGPTEKRHSKISIKIGSAAGADNVYAREIDSNAVSFSIPSGTLKRGNDYFVSIAVGDDDGFGDFQVLHFRTNGSRWQDAVSNSTGWTIETTFRINEGYQGLRIYDGSKHVELRFYADRMTLISSQIKTFTGTFSAYSTITVTGKNSDVKVYKDYNLIADGTGLLQKSTTDKLIEFGSINSVDSSSADYLNFYYTVAGAYTPTVSSQYNDMVFETFYEIDGSIDHITSADGEMYFAATSSEQGASSDIFKVSDYKKPVTAPTVSKTFSPINRITTSPNGKYTYFSHARGATVFSNYVVSAPGSDLDFTVSDDPADQNWEVVDDIGVVSYVATGLNVDSLLGGKAYYTQKLRGTDWFDNVSNAGWTASFSLAVSSINDDRTASNTDAPDGFGVYFNDGRYHESVYFYPREIYFANSKTSVAYDTTSMTDYTIVGRGRGMKLFARKGSRPFELVSQVPLTARASEEGNAGRPAVFEDSEGEQHCVWHDDGSRYRKIYYSRTTNGEWGIPQPIADLPFGAGNPDVAVDSDGTVYVVFEDERHDYTDVGMVVKNTYGWSEPFTVVTGIGDSVHPRIGIDTNKDVHIVWEDGRLGRPEIFYATRTHATGNWSEPLAVTDTQYGCRRPALAMNGTTAYVSYTEMIAGGLQKIAAKRSSHWTTTAYFTTGSYAYADFSDIVVCDDVVYVAWQDVSDNNFQIYARRANSGFGMLGVQVKLTSSTSEPSRFPSLGARGGSGAYNGNVYLVWERGGDIYPDIGYYGTAAGNATTPYVNGAYYDRTVGSWLSENVTKIVGSTTYGGKNVRFVGTDNRYSRRPRIAKSFSGDAHVVYETEIAVSTDEYLTTPDTFALARDAVWDLSYTTDYSLTLAKDLPVSGSLPRKEIRFGDFSETISGQFTFGSFKYFTGDAVEPFDISLISSETQPVLDNRSFVAAVNDQGDAWIGTHKGLSFYFRSAKEMAHCSAFSSAIRAVAFDANNIMLVGTDDGKVYASYDHLAFTELSIDGASGVVTDIAVAPDNGVWVSTSESGIFRIETTGAFAPLANGSGTLGEITVTAYGVATGLPSNNVTRVKLDSSGTAWAATDKGLVKIDGSSVQVFDETNSAIPSARVNDVAIRDASTRYIATASGLAVMSGGAIEQIDIHDSNWNGNVKSVCFKSPNIIWAGTMSYLFQITADDGNYTWTSYDPSSYTLSAGAYDDLRTFYATGLAGMPTDDGSLVEVYVNNRPVKHGYALSKTEEFWAVQFASPLLRSDVVEIKIRTDITQYTSLAQNRAEQIAYGTKVRTVGKMVTDGEQMYVVTEGDEPGLLRYDHSTAKVRPYDKIGLDTTPPTGTLRFDKQIDRGTIQMSVPDAADNLSGIDSMKVANYDNFTSDGVTELPWVPFDEQFNHSLGFDLGLTSVELTISGATGAKVMRYENGTDKPLYAGTSFPARVYKYDATALEWNLVTTLDVDDDGTANPSASIEFMASYLGRIVVGTGDSGGIGKVYVSVDGENFSLLASIAGTHAYCATEFNDVLYIGTGGSGKVYTYDGTNIRETYSGLGTNVYGIAAYNNRVYLATGEQGRVYSIDPVAGTSLITHVDADSQVSSVLGVFINETEPTSSDDTTAAPGTAIVLDSTAELDTEDGEDVPSGKHVIFAGTANTSRVIKSENKNPFITSFVTVTGKRVPFIKVFNGTVYAAVGRTLLYYGAGAWLTKRSVSQDINDVFIDENDNIWIVTDSYLYASKTDITRKTIYLKLKDRAGNETVATSEGLSVSIEIEDLESFTHENRILELDEYGTPLSTYDGDSPFFSADKIETERGVFYSEIFNGTNDHVSWGTLYWDAVVPTGTDVVIGVRSAKTKASLLDEDWTEYTKDRYTGVDVSSFAGQFIQFRATLTSTVRGVSPSLYKVVITSIIKSSVHFFTTNFVLPSRVRKGIITSRKIVPVSADIVFGIDTNNSVDFADYQIVDENKVFTTAFDQAGKNIRVGVKLIAPTRPALQTDSYSEYDPYGDQLFVNVVDFDYTNSGTSGKKNFKVTFYGDYGRTEEVAVLDTSTSQEGWSVDGLPFPEGGYQVANGGTVSVICSIKGTSALRCNQYYYVTIEETADDVVLDDNSGFVSGCNTSFVDEMVFDFTNTALTSKTFHFRIRAYDEAERTTVVKTYSSTSSVVGWTVDDASLPGVGTLVTSGQTVSIGLLPDVSDLETDKVYYLTVDSFDGTTFESVSKSWTFRVNPVSSESCGEYSDVPVLKNFVIMFELEDGSTVMLNT